METYGVLERKPLLSPPSQLILTQCRQHIFCPAFQLLEWVEAGETNDNMFSPGINILSCPGDALLWRPVDRKTLKRFGWNVVVLAQELSGFSPGLLSCVRNIGEKV